jgi:hypothetical protein
MYRHYIKTGITPIDNYADAVNRWESIKPVRGRTTDDRPLGKRRNSHMLIVKNDDGSVACRLYETNVVTFYPDNKVRLCVPPTWRTPTTAQFIEAVLGWTRVDVAVKDNDVILIIKGDDPRHVRLGSEVVLEMAQGGSLKLVSNNKQHTVFAIDRKAMREARNKVAPFVKYMHGAFKLREGSLDMTAWQDSLAYLVDNKIVPPNAPAKRTWFNRSIGWTLEVDQMVWQMEREFEAKKAKEVMTPYMFFLDRAQHGDYEDWNHLVCWMIASAGYVNSNLQRYETHPHSFEKILDNLLLATHPKIFVKKEEEHNKVQVNRYKTFTPFIKLLEELE